MLGQTSLPNENPPPALQLEANRAALFQDASSQIKTRLVWTGFGFAVLILIGISACALVPTASHASAKASRHVSTVAFKPFLPELVKRGGSRQRSSPVTTSVWMHPRWGYAQVSDYDRYPIISPKVQGAQTKLERQFAPHPVPPPLPADDGDSGGGEGLHLKRFSPSEACRILDDWITRVHVLLKAQPAGRHDPAMNKETLQELESFRSFIRRGIRQRVRSFFEDDATEDKALYGLVFQHTPDKPLVIAGGRSTLPEAASPSHTPQGRLEIKYISVMPDMPADGGGMSMESALGDLARHESLTVIFDNVNKPPQAYSGGW